MLLRGKLERLRAHVQEHLQFWKREEFLELDPEVVYALVDLALSVEKNMSVDAPTHVFFEEIREKRVALWRVMEFK